MNIDFDFNKFADIYRKLIISENVSASGNLANNVSCSYTIDEGCLIITLSLPDYWYYVENGRKPGKMPPLVEISKWLKIKRIPFVPTRSVRRKEQLAFPIARKIAIKGTEGKHLLEKAMNSSEWNSSMEELKEIMIETLLEDVKR